MDGKTLGVDENPHANQDPKSVIQEIIWRLTKHFQGKGAHEDEVIAALNEAFAEAGIPEQPAPWVNATALEIAGSREVVMDVQDQVEPARLETGDETVTVRAAPTGMPDHPGGRRPDPDDADGPQPTAQERAAE